MKCQTWWKLSGPKIQCGAAKTVQASKYGFHQK